MQTWLYFEVFKKTNFTNSVFQVYEEQVEQILFRKLKKKFAYSSSGKDQINATLRFRIDYLT